MTTKDSALNCGAVSNSFVRVDSAVRLLAVEEFLNKRLHLGDTSRSANKHNFVDFRSLHASVVEDLFNWFEGVLEEISAEFFELGASKGLLEINAVHQSFDEDLDLLHGRKVAFRLFNFGLEFLESSRVLLDVNIVLLFKDLDEVVSHALIEIFAAKMRVSCRGKHFKHTIINGQQRHIKGATAKIKHDNVLLLLLVETVSDSGSGRLIDNAEHFEACDCASIFGGLSLSIVEVSGYGNNGVLYLLAEVVFSSLLHLHQNHGRDFFGGECFQAGSGHLNRNVRLATFGDDIIGEPFNVSLDFFVVKFTANKALSDIN